MRVAVERLPFPASMESIVTLFEYILSIALCTFTWTVQVPAGKAGFEKVIVPEPAVAVTEPPQLFTMVGVVATTRFDGRPSLKLPLIGTELPLVMLKVTVDGVFVATVVGLKLLAIEGGARMSMPALTKPPVELARPEAVVV